MTKSEIQRMKNFGKEEVNQYYLKDVSIERKGLHYIKTKRRVLSCNLHLKPA